MQRSNIFLKCILLIALWFSQGVLAQPEREASLCSDVIVKSVGNHFNLDNFSYPASGMYPSTKNGGLIVAGICKPWPANNSRIIAAFAYDAGVEFEKQLLLAVIDAPSNRVIAFYRGTIPEDAASEVNADSLRLDTARYILSKTTRAFGLRTSTFRDRCSYEGGFDDQLTLYVIDGKQLRPILSETMWQWRRYGAGNPCGGEDVPTIDAKTFISVENTSSNGFADLRLSVKSNAKQQPPSVVVKYNGENYDLAPWTKVFGSWWEAIDPNAQPSETKGQHRNN